MCFHGTIRLGEQATRERRLLFDKKIAALKEMLYLCTIK